MLTTQDDSYFEGCGPQEGASIQDHVGRMWVQNHDMIGAGWVFISSIYPDIS